MANFRNIVLRVDNELHKEIKMHVIEEETTLQSYVVGLIKKDLEKAKKQKNRSNN